MEQKTNSETKPGKTAIVAGAGGLTGSFLLEGLSKDPYFEKIIVLSRKPGQSVLPKVLEIGVDFDKLESYSFWSDADVLFCCIGNTISKAKSRENFRKVDYEIPVKLATLCELHHIAFHLISSLGANAESPNFYLKTKGQTEEALKAIGLPGLFIYRPSMLFGPRKETRIGESMGKAIMWLTHPLLQGLLKKYRGIHVKTVASAMIKNAKDGKTGTYIFESEELKEIAKNSR
jgi:uncharacterized protein YbjT (DUF2867 family)